MLSLFRQLPRLIGRIKAEHQWLLNTVEREKIDGVISDNRYGLWHPKRPCVILTHQPGIKTGLGRLADDLLRRAHYRYLRRFPACWIVDTQGAGNLAGDLSHPAAMLPAARFIGWLSQLRPPTAATPERHLLILLSGPEPQRSILSDILWRQACSLDMPVAFVEGSPSAVRKDIPLHINHFPRVAGGQLQSLLESASLVVCRSGYSTLMDLAILGKKAILIPTPGQTEQEYLAGALAARGICYAAPQKGFSLAMALAAAQGFPFRLAPGSGYDLYKEVLEDWVARL
jgi:predicted glycosyltransferase